MEVWVRDGHLAFARNDAVSLHGRGVDTFERGREAELRESAHAAGLQELADNAVGFGQVALDQETLPACVRERVGERTARDAAADDDDLGLELVDLGTSAGFWRRDGRSGLGDPERSARVFPGSWVMFCSGVPRTGTVDGPATG